MASSAKVNSIGMVAPQMNHRKRNLTPFENFTKAMDGLMAVPHSEIKAALDKEKREKARKKRAKNQPAPSAASDRVSDTED